MNAALLQVILSMLAGILLLVILATRFRIAVFFAIMAACFLTGFGSEMSLPAIIHAMKTGFGGVMQSLGIIIVLGTFLGALLEYSGAASVMANYIFDKVGKKNAPLSMNITGFIVGLPIFCDSGFIVLSGLNWSLTRRAAQPIVAMSISLASGLYVVHCLLPPHPGAAAAAGTFDVDFGKLILYGIIVAIPTALTGYWWARVSAKRIPAPDTGFEESKHSGRMPSVFASFLPVIVPIILIGARSLLSGRIPDSPWATNLLAIGDPIIALAVAIILAALTTRERNRIELNRLAAGALEKAGSILLITGMGGAFGAILAAANLGDLLGQVSSLKSIGLLFPFLLAFSLKTAQGSSTVAIVTTASIVFPMLNSLGLDHDHGRLLTVLAMGAGSMMISHANDSYFWVIARFSGIDMKSMLRTHTVATLLMGLTGIGTVLLLSLALL